MRSRFDSAQIVDEDATRYLMPLGSVIDLNTRFKTCANLAIIILVFIDDIAEVRLYLYSRASQWLHFYGLLRVLRGFSVSSMLKVIYDIWKRCSLMGLFEAKYRYATRVTRTSDCKNLLLRFILSYI